MIEETFREYLKAAFPEGCPVAQAEELRRTWYASYMAAFTTLTVSAAAMQEDDAVALFDKLHLELDQYQSNLKAALAQQRLRKN